MKMQIEWMPANESGLQNFKECFDRNSSPKDLAVLQWQYLKNPFSPPIAALGKDVSSQPPGATAGVYAVFSTRFLIDGQRHLGSQSLDTMTDKDYRGQGVFMKLATACYDHCSQSNISFVYGFPNGNSAPGFFGKLGWTNLDPVPFLVRPLQLNYILSKIPFLKHIASMLPSIAIRRRRKIVSGNYSLTKDVHFGPETDAIWESFSKNVGCAIDRSAEYLEWRFNSKPGEQYQIVGCRDQDGKLVAFCIYCVKEKHGGRIGYVMEALHYPAHGQATTLCIHEALNAMQSTDCDAVLSWCMPHSINFQCYVDSGFIELPTKLRPIELHFGARCFKNQLQAALLDRRSWYLSYCDSDTV